jgi:peptide/nickel transport system substrate-binding protein
MRFRLGLRRVAPAALLTALAVSLAACGGAPTGASTAPAGPLTITAYPGTSLDWWPPIPTTANCGRPGGITGPDMYLPVLWLNSANQIAFGRHSLASGLRVNATDTTFTITLNPKWHWSNGQPVTAQDVVYYYRLIRAASQPSAPLSYCYVGSGGFPTLWKSVTAQGAHTVVVTTTTPTNPVWFEHNGLTQLVAMPQSVWGKYASLNRELAWISSIGDNPSNPVYQVVDGPYRPLKAVPDEYWEFAANPRYDGVTKPAYARIIDNYETSDASAFVALRTGRIQVDPYVTFDYLAEVQHLAGYRLVEDPSYGFYYLQLNFRPNAKDVGGLFNQLYIRQALQLGIDQPAIIRALYHGLALPTYGPVPYAPHNVFYDYRLKNPYPYNPAAGKRLLLEHGWKLVNGVMQKDGQRLAFPLLLQTGTSSTELGEILQHSWSEEGIQVSLVPQSIDTLYGIIGNPAKSNTWAMAGGDLFGWLYIPDFEPSGGSLFATGAGFNLGGYTSSVMDHLIALTHESGTPAQVQQRFFAYERFAAQQLPVLYQPTPDILTAVANQVKGYAGGFNPIESYTPWNYLHP